MTFIVTFDATDIKNLPKIIEGIMKEGAKVDPVLKRCGEYMLVQTANTFKNSGRGPVRWAPLSMATLAIRKSRKQGRLSKRPLIGTGTLEDSFTAHVEGPSDERELVISSSHKAAKIHQSGARIRVFGGARARIPARPMLFYTKEDHDEIMSRFVTHLDGVLKKAVEKKGRA